MWSRGRDISGELMPEADFAGVDRRATGVRGGSEKYRLSERRGAAISSLEIPSPQYGGDRGPPPEQQVARFQIAGERGILSAVPSRSGLRQAQLTLAHG